MSIKKIFLSVICLAVLGGAADVAAQTRIRFAKGRTSATITGTATSGGVRRYVLGARAGQYLSGNISSHGDCVKFTDGSTSLGLTTDSGDNWLSVTNYCGRQTSFTMTISINEGSGE